MYPASVDTLAWRAAEGVETMTWTAFDDLDIDAVMTTRNGGVSAGVYKSLNLALHVGDDDALVVENRRRAAAALGAGLEDLVFCNQTHGRHVRTVTLADGGRGTGSLDTAVDGIDALVTADSGPVLAMLVADCVAVVLYSPRAHVAAAVHSGWRGTVARVSEAALGAMVDLGASADDVVAGIGPTVDPERYQVGPEVARAVTQCFGDDTDDVLRADGEGGSGTYLFDLWTANRRILLEAGVRPDRIHVANVPSGGGGPFFSDREARPCGRNALLVRLRPRS
jgi:YfiH family protein